MDVKENKFVPNPKSFKSTFCVFYERDLNEIEDKILDYESASGSKYYYTEVGMYRFSNHWGRLANCKWRLVETNSNLNFKYKLGFASWVDFYPDNKFEALYYLEYNPEFKTIIYEHKNNPKYDGLVILRTSDETMKRIKTARNILNLSNWAKYFNNKSIDELRSIIINELIYTNKTIERIKMELYESE